MATTYKVLGQSAPSATTNTDLYTVPSATSAVCSTLAICNRGTSTFFRVAVRPAGATLANEHYVVYDSAISAGDAIFLTLGLSLATTDVVTVYANTANLSFSLFGSEVS
jgi:hypothetical protein